MNLNVMNTTSPEVFVSEPRKSQLDSITAILERAGHPCPQSWLPTLSPDVMASENDPQYQRFLINRYWRAVLGNFEVSTGIDTKQARFCLLDSGTEAQWLNLFETGVVPCIINNNLPITLN
jgi:hypothetical protein